MRIEGIDTFLLGGEKHLSPEQLRNFGLFLHRGIEEGWIPMYPYSDGRCGKLRPMWLMPFVDKLHPIDHEEVVKASKGYIAVLRAMNLSPRGTGSPNAEDSKKPLLSVGKEAELDTLSQNLAGLVYAYGDDFLEGKWDCKKVKKHFMQYLKALKDQNVIFELC